MSGSYIWKQTIDGQWQPFQAYKNKLVSLTEGLYKPSSMTAKQTKCTDCEKSQKKVSVSTTVWTPKGYGVVKEITDNDIKVKISQTEEEKEISLPPDEAKRTIDLVLRVLEGQKFEWIKISLSINTKISDLLNLLSALYNRPPIFITLYQNGKKLDKKDSLNECKVDNEASILVTLTSGGFKVFKRFREISTGYWYVTNSWDAVMFKSQRSLIVTGFGVYKHLYTSNYQIKYKFFREDDEIITETKYAITSGMIKDRVAPVKMKTQVTVPANTNFTVMYIFENVSGQSNHAHYGQNGSNPQDIEGNDKYIEVIYSNRDQNGSGNDRGQIPELHYIPL